MTATPDDIVTSRTRDVQPTVFSEPWPSDVLPWSEDDVTTAPTGQRRHERHTESFTASSARGRPRVRLVRNVDPAQQRSSENLDVEYVDRDPRTMQHCVRQPVETSARRTVSSAARFVDVEPPPPPEYERFRQFTDDYACEQRKISNDCDLFLSSFLEHNRGVKRQRALTDVEPNPAMRDSDIVLPRIKEDVPALRMSACEPVSELIAGSVYNGSKFKTDIYTMSDSREIDALSTSSNYDNVENVVLLNSSDPVDFSCSETDYTDVETDEPTVTLIF